jgi:hypothetical protein
MAMPKWTIVCYGGHLAYDTAVGEVLNARNLNVQLPLSKASTAGFSIRMDHPLADKLLSANASVRIFRDSIPVFGGIVLSSELVAERENGTVAVNCIDPSWLLTKSFSDYEGDAGSVYNEGAYGAMGISYSLIARANATGWIPIAVLGSAASDPLLSQPTMTYKSRPFVPVMQQIQELADSDGFTWRVRAEGVGIGALGGFITHHGTWNNADAVYGTINTSEAIFEWGMGRKNLQGFRHVVSRENQANGVWNIVGDANNPYQPPVVGQSTTSVSTWGIMSELVQSEVLDTALRQQLVDEHVAVRKFPRQTIEVTPNLTRDAEMAPRYMLDYDVGTTVKLRIGYNGAVRVNSEAMIWQIGFNVDDNGVERQTLTLSENG